MELNEVIETIIKPSYKLLPEAMNSDKATVMLLAIGLQESRFEHRWQIVDLKNPHKKGPARGFWQFEKGGGVHGVLTHRRTAQYAHNVCRNLGVKGTANDIYDSLSSNDKLACCFARLLLWTDAGALPIEQEPAWNCYIRNWRPGKPHPATWPDLFKRAKNAVYGE